MTLKISWLHGSEKLALGVASASSTSRRAALWRSTTTPRNARYATWLRGERITNGSRSARVTEVDALFYSLIESSKLFGVVPNAYLRRAARAAIRGETIPLPHELVN